MNDADVRVAAIVLAAGDSTRMGSQKLLLPFDGKTVIEHIVDTLIQARFDSIVIVTGRDGKAVEEVLGKRALTIAANPDPSRGMLSSVRVGIEAVGDACDGYMVVLGDQPAIQAPLVNKLVIEFSKDTEGIWVPAFDGRRGHPMILSFKYRQAVLERYDDQGLRGLLREYAGSVHDVAVQDSWVLDDMDYPRDYERELRRLEEG